MQPLAHFFVDRENLADWDYLSIRARSGNSLQVIELLNKLWKDTEPASTVDYFFAIDKLNVYYKEYIRINKIVAWFSAIAIILSCMGLFALSSFFLIRKTKEIGIRKVNGAKIYQIMLMLNRNFLKWVAVAFVIAVPVAWYGLHKWLQTFASKTELSCDIPGGFSGIVYRFDYCKLAKLESSKQKSRRINQI